MLGGNMPKVVRFFNEEVSGPGYWRQGALRLEDEDGRIFSLEVVPGTYGNHSITLVKVEDKE
jgi:hypothetical protein